MRNEVQAIRIEIEAVINDNPIREKILNGFKKYEGDTQYQLLGAKEVFDKLCNTYSAIHKSLEIIEYYPQEFFDDLQNKVVNFKKALLDMLDSYSIEKASAVPNRMNGMRKEIHKLVNTNYLNILWLYIEKIKVSTLDTEIYMSRSEQYLAKIQDVLKSTSDIEANIKNIKEHAEESAGKIGISTHAKIFWHQALFHAALAVLFAAIIGISLYFGYMEIMALLQNTIQLKNVANITGKEVVDLLQKLLILSIFSIVLYQLFKNFNAQMHLYVINNHKKNALLTFRSFVDAGESDVDVKHALLMMTAKSIFDINQTGYIKDNKEDGDINMYDSVLNKLKEKDK